VPSIRSRLQRTAVLPTLHVLRRPGTRAAAGEAGGLALFWSASVETKAASYDSAKCQSSDMGSVAELKFSERSGRKPISLGTVSGGFASKL
jgi:hypothetical protein